MSDDIEKLRAVADLARYAMDLRNNGDPYMKLWQVFDALTHALADLDAAPASTESYSGWTPITESSPPIGVDVLVTDGEDVKMDHQYLCYKLDGRVLLPSDPRRATTEPERRFATYGNITHWRMPPAAPGSTPGTGRDGEEVK
jgi:hypothetical protein